MVIIHDPTPILALQNSLFESDLMITTGINTYASELYTQ